MRRGPSARVRLSVLVLQYFRQNTPAMRASLAAAASRYRRSCPVSHAPFPPRRAARAAAGNARHNEGGVGAWQRRQPMASSLFSAHARPLQRMQAGGGGARRLICYTGALRRSQGRAEVCHTRETPRSARQVLCGDTTPQHALPAAAPPRAWSSCLVSAPPGAYPPRCGALAGRTHYAAQPGALSEVLARVHHPLSDASSALCVRSVGSDERAHQLGGGRR